MIKRRQAVYLGVPAVLLVLWIIGYYSWMGRRRSDVPLRVDQLPPPTLVWPEPRPKPDTREQAEAKQRIERLQAELLANAAEELRAHTERVKRNGVVLLPSAEPPEQAAVESSSTLPDGKPRP